MSISLEEVRHIAALARLGVDDGQAATMAVELSSILEHMQVLAKADLGGGESPAENNHRMPLRADVGPPIPLTRMPNDFAPEFRDGFFLVPRLDTHEDVDSAS